MHGWVSNNHSLTIAWNIFGNTMAFVVGGSYAWSGWGCGWQSYG